MLDNIVIKFKRIPKKVDLFPSGSVIKKRAHNLHTQKKNIKHGTRIAWSWINLTLTYISIINQRKPNLFANFIGDLGLLTCATR